MAAFVAALPLINLGLQFLPAIIDGIKAARGAVPKVAGIPLSPQQVSTAQAVALAVTKPSMLPIAAKENVPLPDEGDISKTIEFVYQLLKSIQANHSDALAVVLPAVEAIPVPQNFQALEQALLSVSLAILNRNMVK